MVLVVGNALEGKREEGLTDGVEVVRLIRHVVLGVRKLEDRQRDGRRRGRAVRLDKLVRRHVDVGLVQHQQPLVRPADDQHVAVRQRLGRRVPAAGLQVRSALALDEVHGATFTVGGAGTGGVGPDGVEAVAHAGLGVGLGAREVDHGAVREEGAGGTEGVAFWVQLAERVGVQVVLGGEDGHVGAVVDVGIGRVGSRGEADACAAEVGVVATDFESEDVVHLMTLGEKGRMIGTAVEAHLSRKTAVSV